MHKTILPTLALAACAPLAPEVGDGHVALQRARTADGFVAVDILAVDDDGQTVGCDDGSLTATATLTTPDGDVLDVSQVEVACQAAERPDVAMVLDNSGSQEEVLDITRDAAHTYVDEILAAGGRVSLVRVSTFSQPLVPLTDDGPDLHAALDGLFVNRGWTALYDAVRMGNEHLAASPAPSPASDLDAYCAGDRTAEMVVFSNGVDNNSDEARLTGDATDGIDTRFSDLTRLSVAGVPTPVHTIGLGRALDDQLLASLSAATGGGHVTAATPESLGDAFGLAGTWTGETFRVCLAPQQDVCGPLEITIEWELRGGCNQGVGNGPEDCDPGNSNQGDPANSNDENGGTPGNPGRSGGNGNGGTAGQGGGPRIAQGTTTETLYVPCATGAVQGDTATVLFPLTTGALPPGQAKQIVRDVVGRLAAGPGAAVVVIDDADTGDDAALVAAALDAAGWTTTLLAEDDEGVAPSDLAGVDLVWWSSPSHPIDDWRAADTLAWFAGTGGDVVLQGDDMAAGLGGAFGLDDLTGLVPLDNGHVACDRKVDGDHPWIVGGGTGALGTPFDVPSDLDRTAPRGLGEEVLAWASAGGCSDATPAVVVWTR